MTAKEYVDKAFDAFKNNNYEVAITYYSKAIEIDEEGYLYIDYLPLNAENVEKICFGPKAEGMDKFKLLLARKGYSGKACAKSKAPLA